MSFYDIDVDCDCGESISVDYREFDLHEDYDCNHDDCWDEDAIQSEIKQEVRNGLRNHVRAVQWFHENANHTTMVFDNCNEIPCRDLN